MGFKALVTGGAGFVGAHLALAIKRRYHDAEVIAFDNLKRRGSELALQRLEEGGVDFVHGDVRDQDDLAEIGPFDLMIMAAAESSVQSGYDGGSSYVVRSNLSGTIHCLEMARRHRAGVIFLSTSRVYPIERLRRLPLEREGDRLVIPPQRSGHGWSSEGITTDFPLMGARSLYGATKLSSELLVQEYAVMYRFPAIINRCGVIAGPWQLGCAEQGFVTYWALQHHRNGKLQYRGYDGEGIQVRDILHIDDLCELVTIQIERLKEHQGTVFVIGGGAERSASLRELSALCEEISGKTIDIDADPETPSYDVPYYVSDNRDVLLRLCWRPRRSVKTTLRDIFEWIQKNDAAVTTPRLNARTSQNNVSCDTPIIALEESPWASSSGDTHRSITKESP